MEIFDAVEKEYPSLKKYRDKVYTQFMRHYTALVDFFLKAHGGKIYSHSLVINGAILRSLNFYRGAIWALGTRNPHVFFDSLRAQCETLGLIHYCVLNPKYVVPATIGERKHPEENLKIVNVITLIEKVEKKYKGIRQDFDDLCELVHPNPASLYANILPKTQTKKGSLLIVGGTRSPRVTEAEAEKYLKILIYWTDWIFEELTSLVKLFL